MNMNMNMKLFVLVIVVAGCAFSTEGFPAQSKEEPTGYLGYFRNAANQAYNYVWGNSNPKTDKPSKPEGTGTDTGKETGTGIFGGGLLTAGVGAVGTGLYNGVGAVGTGLYNGAGTVGTGLYNGAGTVGTGLYNGAGTVGTGLYNGAGTVGTGLYNGAAYVTSVGVNGIIASLGAGSHYTLSSLASALAAVNPESLTKALGLPDLSKALPENMGIYNILTKLVLGQAEDPKDGVMNYAIASIFLQRLVEMVPQLKKTVSALQTVSYVMNRIRQLQSENKPIDSYTLMGEALELYFKDVDPAFKNKLVDMSPLVYKAAFGDSEAALTVVTSLADKETVVAALKGMGFKGQIELIQMVIGQVAGIASSVKEQDAAQNASK